MQTETYECLDYKSRLYKTNDDILLLDIFINNKEKCKISINYYENILYYKLYKINKIWHTVYDDGQDSWKFPYHIPEKIENLKHSVEINFNKIYPMLNDYDIYNAERYKKDYQKNLISVTLIRKGLLKEFTAQIDEDKINIKWMTSWMK